MAMQLFFPVSPDFALLIENVFISGLSCGVDDIPEVLDVDGDDKARAVGDALVADDFRIGDDDWLDAMYSSPPLTLKKGSTAHAAGSDSSDLALGQDDPGTDMASRDRCPQRCLRNGNCESIHHSVTGLRQTHRLGLPPFHHRWSWFHLLRLVAQLPLLPLVFALQTYSWPVSDPCHSTV